MDTNSSPLANLSGPGISCTRIESGDSSGCLTFKFISDGTSTSIGWEASFACVPAPCTAVPGTDCANPVIIPSIPYSGCSDCTTCMGNEYNASTPGTCSVSPNNMGDDITYQYTATGPECLNITLNNVPVITTSLQVYQGCPGAGICLAYFDSAVNNTLNGQVILPGAGTYYIIIDTWNAMSICYDIDITPCLIGIDEASINGNENISVLYTVPDQVIIGWNNSSMLLLYRFTMAAAD
jgi:hypothetical protein